MGSDSSTSLAPGFRFHPTDEELVRYYLKRKVCGKPLRVDPISVIDIYKYEPWDLPEKSKLKTRDLEWYYFSVLDKKYGNGSRTNRATLQGYWKTTGKDRPISHSSRTVGMKKTLVYHSGRAPKGVRSNWVMHEYRLQDVELVNAGVPQDAFVLCRIFQKSGTGPKNGEQYGAPFIEEEWEDDVMAVVPGEEVPGEEVLCVEGVVDDGVAFGDVDDLEQNFAVAIPTAVATFPSDFYDAATGIYVDQYGNFIGHDQSEIAALPPNFYHGETSNYVEPSGDFSEGDVKPVIDEQATVLGSEEKFFEIPQEQYVIDPEPGKEEYFVQPSNEGNPMDADNAFVDQFLNVTENALSHEGLYLDDLSKPIEDDHTGFDLLNEYLTYFDAEDGNIHFPALDSSQTVGVENAVTEQEPQNVDILASGQAELPMGTQQVVEAHGNNRNNASSSSEENAETTKSESDFKHPFLKQASQMLGSIPAPPAFASEFPTKEAALRQNSASSSVHVTAGMIRIRNLNPEGNATYWSIGKNGDVDLLLSYYSLPQADVSNSSTVSPSGKTGCVVTKGWFMFMFIWVLIMSVSFKIGSYIYTKSCFDS